MTVQAHFMPHDAKALDPARSMNVLVGTAGSSSLLHFCCCPGTPGEPHIAMLRQPKQGKDHFQGEQSGLPTLWTDGSVCVEVEDRSRTGSPNLDNAGHDG